MPASILERDDIDVKGNLTAASYNLHQLGLGRQLTLMTEDGETIWIVKSEASGKAPDDMVRGLAISSRKGSVVVKDSPPRMVLANAHIEVGQPWRYSDNKETAEVMRIIA